MKKVITKFCPSSAENSIDLIQENEGSFHVFQFKYSEHSFSNETTLCEPFVNYGNADANIQWIKIEQQKNKYSPTTNVFDVSAYIIKKIGAVSTLKLQKLVYYSQAWSLVWDERPLFSEKIEAWANGPVVRDLFNFHRGVYVVNNISIGNPDKLDENQKDTIDKVLEFYGNKSASWLVELTHMEAPWQNARRGLLPLDRGNNEITLDSLALYYSSLV